jgi:hypothetical protein
MSLYDVLHGVPGPRDEPRGVQIWRAVREEAREVAWLLVLVAGLSVTGVALGVLLAAT